MVSLQKSTLIQLKEGLEISEELGIIKYEEPEPTDPNVESEYPHYLRKTGEELVQNINLQGYYGELVDVSLKIDGKSCSHFEKDGNYRICGRRVVFKPETDNIYTQISTKFNIQSKLAKFNKEFNLNVAFRGEIAGEGISKNNKNPYRQKPKSFYLFGIYNNNSYENYGPNSEFYFEKVGKLLDIPTVPIIEKQVPLTIELIEKYRDMELLDGEYFEGVVIVGEGFSFKIINLNYDSKK